MTDEKEMAIESSNDFLVAIEKNGVCNNNRKPFYFFIK
jgi:hypothetical protein